MSLSIEEIEKQIAELQKHLEHLKNPKMEVIRQFTGQYFAPYQDKQYRRMESEGIPIWEYVNEKKEWVILDKKESDRLEQIYKNDSVSSIEQK